MTLYMAFEAIKTGRLSLDQHLVVSRNASRQPPSKIGLRAGRTITVRDAIQACATKSANGRNFRATNKLLGKYSGADGIKTGYTNASGYNLVASAEQNGRRIVGVVFGGRSSARRNRHMRKLLDNGFKIAPKRTSHVGSVLPDVDYYLESPLPRLSPKRGGTVNPPIAIAALARNESNSVVDRGLAALSSVIVTPAQAATQTAKNGNYSIQIPMQTAPASASRPKASIVSW